MTPNERRLMELALQQYEAEAELDARFNRPPPKDFMVGGVKSAREVVDQLRKDLEEDAKLP